MAGPIESEVKLRFDSPEAARGALRKMGARAARPRHFEDNTLYDDPARSLFARGVVVRLRRTAAGAIVTYKGPRIEVAAGVKSRPEVETSVSDPDAFEAILAGLGLAKTFRYQKYREVFGWEDAEIVVDETPLGTWVEIEGPIETIHRAASAMGKRPADYVAESYASLFFASGRTGDMVFGG